MSLPQPDVTEFTEMHTEQSSAQATSYEEREPTFSSEEGLTPSLRGLSNGAVRGQYNDATPTAPYIAPSSPAPSVTFTPTPAFQPRPRARFNLPPTQASTTPPDPITDTDADGTQDDHVDESTWRPEHLDEAMTPHTHKRSFLLSVINSTARPRLKHLTPHPHRTGDVPETPAVDPPVALAGVTPGPRTRLPIRPRLSHPLAQAWTAQPQSDSGSDSGGPAGYDPTVDRASFLSTASSQDLTTHARANASFDPVMGLGERGHGVGRFNANKLNNYLHTLNRKLQEENELLVSQLRAYEEQHGKLDAEKSQASSAGQQGRRASAGRTVNAGPFGLGDVAEDAWVEEKAQMEDMVDEMREELENVTKERDGTLRALEEEREDRVRDKERWRQRMSEVEKGVQEIVEDLDRKLHDAEQKAQAAERDKTQTVKEVERRLAEVVIERDVLAERMEKAEGALESGQDLGASLNAANERVGKVLGDLKNANIQIKGLEEEVMHSDERMDLLEQELREEKKLVAELEDELQVKSDELSQTLQRLESLQDGLQNACRDVEQHKAFALQMEGDANVAANRVGLLQQQLAASQDKIEAITAILDQEQEKTNRLELEADRANELANELEEALDAAEQKMRADEEQINSLKIKVSGLEREVDRSRSRMEASKANAVPDEEMQAEVEALEVELDSAHKEIARLNTIVSQSPSRKAIERAKDTKIEMLEQERDDLLERLKTLKTNTLNIGTPGKSVNISGISPMHRHILSMTMKSPKTPGGPLRDVSCDENIVKDTGIYLHLAFMAPNDDERRDGSTAHG